MTRKDFSVIAGAISLLPSRSERISIANLIAASLEREYSNFNREKFVSAAKG